MSRGLRNFSIFPQCFPKQPSLLLRVNHEKKRRQNKEKRCIKYSAFLYIYTDPLRPVRFLILVIVQRNGRLVVSIGRCTAHVTAAAAI